MDTNPAFTSPTLSAVLITKNESENLRDCLESLSFCDEIVILDNSSEDTSAEIAISLGATFISTTQWLGFGPQKQEVLNAANGRWVLSIDADERVSEELRGSILRAVAMDGDYSYRLRRENYFLGKKMNFGGWAGDCVLRLAKRGHCKFSTDVVHECLICDHPTIDLEGHLTHISYRTINDVLTKQVRYAELGAQKLIVSGKSTRSPTLKAMWTFVRLYVFQLGFLDGWRGTLAASAKSYETFWRYALVSKERN